MANITQAEYNAHLQSTRILHIRIELLNSSDAKIDVLTGVSLSGNVNISSDSLIRRTGNIKFLLSTTLLPSQQSKLAINNKLKLWIEIEDYLGVKHPYCMGIFMIKNVSIDSSSDGKTISLDLVDKMYLLENIPLEAITRFNSNTPISDAMRLVVGTLGNETSMSIDTSLYTLPYNLEFSPDQSVLDVVQKLKELYMNWSAFYDINGRFIFRKTPNTINDVVVWDFKDKADFRINSQVSTDYSNIKNYIKVIGRTNNDGTIASAIVENNDINSPFSIAKIGKKALVIKDDDYFTNDQCLVNGQYQLFKHGNFNEQVSISSVPIYFLDTEQNINFNFPEDELEGMYCVNSIGIDLKFDAQMSIGGYKIY